MYKILRFVCRNILISADGIDIIMTKVYRVLVLCDKYFLSLPVGSRVIIKVDHSPTAHMRGAEAVGSDKRYLSHTIRTVKSDTGL